MKTIEETKQWLLENRIDEDGDLDLSKLDFSDFDGNVYINEMKVKKCLYQSFQKVQGKLFQSYQKVQGNLFQGFQKVQGDLKTQALEKDEEYKIDEYEATYIVKKTKKYTYKELKEKLGHDFEIVKED